MVGTYLDGKAALTVSCTRSASSVSPSSVVIVRMRWCLLRYSSFIGSSTERRCVRAVRSNYPARINDGVRICGRTTYLRDHIRERHDSRAIRGLFRRRRVAMFGVVMAPARECKPVENRAWLPAASLMSFYQLSQVFSRWKSVYFVVEYLHVTLSLGHLCAVWVE